MACIVDASDKVWLERSEFDEAEANFQRHILQLKTCIPHAAHSTKASPFSPIKHSIASEIAKARQHISQTINGEHISGDLSCHYNELLEENKLMKKKIQNLESTVCNLTSRFETLEAFCKKSCGGDSSAPTELSKTSASATNLPEEDFELFGSDEEESNEEADRIKQERLKAYEEKKAKKPQLIAKSNIILDVKPWDDETDMSIVEKNVRSIVMDGLLWGASKLVPLAYGIKKLQISCVVEDDKVSVEDLEDQILAFEDFIQSMDIAAFNKI